MTRHSDLNLVSGANIKSQSATPLTERRYYAISTFAEEFIFVSGGEDASFDVLDSVEYFSVRSNKWAFAPAMKKTRVTHSQCALGDSLFAFFGWNLLSVMDNIERINARKVINGISTKWALIELQSDIQPRY